ncbi:MAG TPA: Hsp33 family molecular chaperone HslO [Spirochaetota bacterium]|nr:Hsp33 family molecular chaperone HslO [Spirochaetota bacterium]HPC41775.1 Hsp33 family molecular chaperone HslO [Spirochaetota bacterium]HPL16555.1 Hsp33 family molecular chaperone HslO [Spirochaetota bacterium]HQF06626.1 Hsp33 family molecular chaperone HslO [Spirochaetota bacterium]HQH95971.1 Hsp33 family molecular chaperone HslO [Spirochaetota bacterium]
MAEDRLTRLICEPLNLRAYTVISLNVAREITSLHNTTPNATVALGRTITAAALLSAMLKPDSEQSLLVKIEGSGPIREIHAQADARGNIRGYAANPQPDLAEDIGALSFSKTIGAGFLTVRRDIGMKEPYTSVIPLRVGEVAGDIAYYLTVSEQIPSAVIIGLTLGQDGSILSSGGILIQTFPETPEEAIAGVEENISSMNMSLGDSLKEGADIVDVVKGLFNNKAVTVLDSRPIRASCRCDRRAIRSMLTSLRREDLREMIDKDGGAEVTCTFCSRQYHFDKKELERILDKKEPSSPADPGKPKPGMH